MEPAKDILIELILKDYNNTAPNGSVIVEENDWIQISQQTYIVEIEVLKYEAEVIEYERITYTYTGSDTGEEQKQLEQVKISGTAIETNGYFSLEFDYDFEWPVEISSWNSEGDTEQ